MKYSNAFRALSDIFETSGLAIWPRDVVPTTRPSPYGEVTFIPNGKGVDLNSVSGLVMIDIIISAGDGPAVAHAFADTLDTYLVKKSLNGTQFWNSSLAPRGVLKSDPTRSVYEYSLPFKYFGVS